MEEGANHSPCEPIQGRRKRDRGLYRDHNGMMFHVYTNRISLPSQVNGVLPLLNVTSYICKSNGKNSGSMHDFIMELWACSLATGKNFRPEANRIRLILSNSLSCTYLVSSILAS